MREKVPAFIVVLVLACGDGPTAPPSGGGTSPPATSVSAVRVTPDSVNVQVRATSQLTASVLDANGGALTGRSVSWASSDAAIAKVDAQNGLVTAVAPGATVITVTSEGKSGSAKVVVRPGAPATLINLGGGGSEKCLAAAPAPLRVKVVDADGFAVPGVTVVFTIDGGGGSFSSVAKIATVSIVADADGTAQTTWVYGSKDQRARASVAGLTDVAFAAVATPAAGPSVLEVQSSPALSAVNRTTIAPVILRARDSCNDPVAIPVTVALAPDGSLSGTLTRQTDVNGSVTFSDLVPAALTGTKSLTFNSSGVAQVFVQVTISSGVASQLRMNAGNDQTAPPSSVVPISPSVKVTDADGNAVAGITVTFAVSSGGGSITSPTSVTNSSGIAQVGSWTLGSSAGQNALSATAPGIAALSFTATGALTSGAASVSKLAGDNQSGPQGDIVSVAPSVIVRDNQGNPVSGVAVSFSAQNGSITGASTTTNSSGVAQPVEWRLGGTVGAAQVTATVTGLPEATFSASVASACSWSYALTIGVMRSGDFQQFDCRAETSVFADRYTTSLPAGMYTFRTQSNSTGLNTVVELYTSATASSLIARNDDETSGSNNALLRAILPASSYDVIATATAANQQGSYTLIVSPAEENVTGCEHAYVAAGTNTFQSLAGGDCVETLSEGVYYEDHYLRRLQAGQQITVSMSSSAFDSYIIIADPNGAELAFNDDRSPGVLDAEITFTAPATGWYMIRTSSSLVGQQGAYSLSVR